MPYPTKNSKYSGTNSTSGGSNSGYSSSPFGGGGNFLGRYDPYGSGSSPFPTGRSPLFGGSSYSSGSGYGLGSYGSAFTSGGGGSAYGGSSYGGYSSVSKLGGLATISEHSTLPSSASSAQRRLPRGYVPSSLYSTPSNYTPSSYTKKPALFDTENIDVTSPRKPATQPPPSSSSTSESSATPGEITRDKTFGTIKRGRTVIRIRTKNQKENPYLSTDERNERAEERKKEKDRDNLVQKLKDELRDEFPADLFQKPAPAAKKAAGDKFREKFMIQSKKKKYSGYRRPTLSDIRSEKDLLQKQLGERLALIATGSEITDELEDETERLRERLAQLERRIDRRYSKALRNSMSTDEDSAAEDTIERKGTLKLKKSSSKNALKLMTKLDPSSDGAHKSNPTTPSDEDKKSPMLKRKATQKFFFPAEGASLVQPEIVDLEAITQPEPEDDFEKNILAHRTTVRKLSHQNVKYIQPRKSSLDMVDILEVVNSLKSGDGSETQKPEVAQASDETKPKKVVKKRKTPVVTAPPILDLKSELVENPPPPQPPPRKGKSPVEKVKPKAVVDVHVDVVIPVPPVKKVIVPPPPIVEKAVPPPAPVDKVVPPAKVDKVVPLAPVKKAVPPPAPVDKVVPPPPVKKAVSPTPVEKAVVLPPPIGDKAVATPVDKAEKAPAKVIPAPEKKVEVPPPAPEKKTVIPPPTLKEKVSEEKAAAKTQPVVKAPQAVKKPPNTTGVPTLSELATSKSNEIKNTEVPKSKTTSPPLNGISKTHNNILQNATTLLNTDAAQGILAEKTELKQVPIKPKPITAAAPTTTPLFLQDAITTENLTDADTTKIPTPAKAVPLLLTKNKPLLNTETRSSSLDKVTKPTNKLQQVLQHCSKSSSFDNSDSKTTTVVGGDEAQDAISNKKAEPGNKQTDNEGDKIMCNSQPKSEEKKEEEMKDIKLNAVPMSIEIDPDKENITEKFETKPKPATLLPHVDEKNANSEVSSDAISISQITTPDDSPKSPKSLDSGTPKTTPPDTPVNIAPWRVKNKAVVAPQKPADAPKLPQQNEPTPWRTKNKAPQKAAVAALAKAGLKDATPPLSPKLKALQNKLVENKETKQFTFDKPYAKSEQVSNSSSSKETSLSPTSVTSMSPVDSLSPKSVTSSVENLSPRSKSRPASKSPTPPPATLPLVNLKGKTSIELKKVPESPIETKPVTSPLQSPNVDDYNVIVKEITEQLTTSMKDVSPSVVETAVPEKVEPIQPKPEVPKPSTSKQFLESIKPVESKPAIQTPVKSKSDETVPTTSATPPPPVDTTPISTAPTEDKAAVPKSPIRKSRLPQTKSKSDEKVVTKKSKSLEKPKSKKRPKSGDTSVPESPVTISGEGESSCTTSVTPEDKDKNNKNESPLNFDKKSVVGPVPKKSASLEAGENQDKEQNVDGEDGKEEPTTVRERLSSSSSSSGSGRSTSSTGSSSASGSGKSSRSRRLPSPPVDDDSDEETVSLDKICPAKNRPKYRKYEVEDFQFLKVLGKGSFGKVLLAELKDSDSYFAIKCLKKDVVLEDDDVECTMIERKVLLMGSKHPYLCHLFCTFQTESHLFFVMEYLNGGDLMFHIQQSGKFTEERARFYAAEIVSGLKFLHKKGVMYRDLKLDNILLDYEGHIRIADFGMCKLQIYLDRTADTFCGTPDYMAPEIIKGLRYNQCVDWWAFGVLLYEMLVGQSPFSGSDEDELFWSICNEQVHFPRFLSKESKWILERLLEKDSSRRLGMASCAYGDVSKQVFFNQIDWDKLEKKELEPPFRPKLKHPLDVQYFDTTFTKEIARLTPVDKAILQSMDQSQFDGFSYTNPHTTD
ncbi:putative protein kinase C delta type [Folsomia candida]|uniref:Uncharacterized protein n=1 Tax=Folsomia candida TaxID=158441 RepID=A0A226DB78_FOLCA|nr:putative protein kinase C delta type [Folsomia candida]